MKKLVVQSDTEAEDIEAASLINRQMREKDCGQIIWYSNMGKKVAQMAALEKVVEKHASWIDSLSNKQGQFFKEISDLRHLVSDQKKVIDTLQKFVDDMPTPPKEGPKKSKEKT